MKVTLVMPKERFSPVDFFFEVVKNPDEITMLVITSAAYSRMKEDTYLQYNRIFKEGYWEGEETPVNGKFYPRIKYPVIKSGGQLIVPWVEFGEEQFTFLKGKKKVIEIDY